MKRLILLLACLLPGTVYSGFYLDAGMSVHSDGWDKPEVIMTNPLGSIELGYEFARIKFYAEHTSSLPDWEYGYGLNRVGVKVRLIGKPYDK